jgi:oxaloacetate decarboxylase gamma subunit
MEVEFSTALSLLAIGMITVFVVLALVVLTGNLLIRFVNRISPDQDGIAPVKIAVITAAVNAFTEGKGKITKIEKH